MRALPLLLLAAIVAPAAAQDHEVPVVYAHRGGAALAPENTLGAFRHAHASFPEVWLELDVQFAGDDELIVIHDPTLDRTTINCTGNVVDMTSAELAGCDARAGWPEWNTFEHVPTLREVLVEGETAGWSLMIEIKNIPGEPNFDPGGRAAATALVALVEEVDYPPEALLVQSFFPTSLDAIEDLRPDIRTALLTTSQLPGAPPGVGFYATQNGAFATARGYDVSAPDHTAPDLTPETVAAIQALGRQVVLWTVDEQADIQHAIALGVDGIITNRPDQVLEAI